MKHLNKRKWIKEESSAKNLSEKILQVNNIKDKDKFINLSLSDMHDPLKLNDVKKAREIISSSIKEKEKIVLYTDYDTDGATGGAVAYLMLKELGADVDYYTNDRKTQGYGLCVSGIDEIKKKYPTVSLIITIDNGIVAFEGVDYCRELGIKIIVTDHHEPGEKLPNALAVINPKRKDSTYPFNELCGATVVWKMLSTLYDDVVKTYKYLDILAIGTIGDVVPLVDENRVIAKEGIKLMNEESRLSLKELKHLTKTSVVDSETLGFLYSPIFNAISRVEGNINPVIEFLISEDEKFITETVNFLIKTNEVRKKKTKKQLELARKILEEKGIKEIIVLYSKEFDEGIVGLIAGRLKDEYNRPVFVFTDGEAEGVLKGSARSIEGYHLKEVLDACGDLLLGYGGHKLAAGMSVDIQNLKRLEERLIAESFKCLSEDDYVKKYMYIDVLSEKDIDIELVKELNKLAPYGEGFKKPLIRIHNFDVKNTIFMGEDKNHLKLEGENISLIAFRQVKNYKEKGSPGKISALGYPNINVFRNQVSVQFIIEKDNFY